MIVIVLSFCAFKAEFHRFFRMLAPLIILGVAAACSVSAPVDENSGETRQLSFRGLYAPFLPLEITVNSDNSLFWRDPPDLGGSGRVCGVESDFTCIILDGFWTFAIPKAVITNARMGESWTFNHVQFDIINIIQFPSISRQSEILVVKSGDSSRGWIIFHFDIQTGLETITYVHPAWEPDNRDQPYIPVLEVRVRER